MLAMRALNIVLIVFQLAEMFWLLKFEQSHLLALLRFNFIIALFTYID